MKHRPAPRWTEYLLPAALAWSPAVAHATSMDGLVFLVVIWPIALVLAAAMIGAIIVGIVRLHREGYEGRLGTYLQGLGLSAGLLFPVFVLTLGRRAPWDPLLITCVPVVVLAVGCLVLGRRLSQKVRSGLASGSAGQDL